MDPDVRRELDELRQRVHELEEELAALRAVVAPLPPDPGPRPWPQPEPGQPFRRPGPPPGTYPMMASATDD